MDSSTDLMQNTHRFAGSVVTLALLVTSVPAIAQNTAVQSTITFRSIAGEMIEIGLDGPSPKSDYSWILTRDRKFQNAQHTRFFQVRPAQAGSYTLDVSVQDPAVARNDYRAFQIAVTEPSGVLPILSQSSGSLKAMMQTDPPAIGGVVHLGEEGSLITIDTSVSKGKISLYSIDIDGSVDSDGDGNPQNDHDNRDTFSEQSGSPLRYLMLPKSQPRTVILTVQDALSGIIDTTTISVLFTAPPASMPRSDIDDGMSEIALEQDEASVRLRPRIDAKHLQGKDVLYEWEFGDRSRSLLTSPIHTYKQSGMYTIALSVRDLRTSQTILTATRTVQIDAVVPGVSGSSSSASIEKPANDTNDNVGTIGSILQVGMIILLLLAFAVGLYLLFVWIKKRTGGKLEKAIASMEKTIIKQEPASEQKIEPVKIKKDPPAPTSTPKKADIVDREKASTEFTAKQNPVPSATVGPVPDWLKPNTRPDAAPKKNPASPTMTPTKTSPAPASVPAPSTIKAAVTTPKAPQAPVKTATTAPVKQPNPLPKPVTAERNTPVATTVTTPQAPPASSKVIDAPRPTPPLAPPPAPAVTVKSEPQPIPPLEAASKTPFPSVVEKQEKAATPKEMPIAIIQADSLMNKES